MYSEWVQLPTQYIHGDCHGGNLLFDGKDVTGFIDLDHLPIGARVYDLSYFLADEIKTRIDNNDKLITWLGSFEYLFWGYAHEMPLTPLEINTVWYGMLFTQLLFIDWFTTHNDKDQIVKNLATFNWIYTHRDNINKSLTLINVPN